MNGGMYLVRHGALPSDPHRRMVGASDVPLSAAGREQVRLLARRIMPCVRRNLCAALCSDLDRCRETAALLLGGRQAQRHSLDACSSGISVPLHLEPGLREICLGRWQGMTLEEIEKTWPGAYAARGRDMANFCPPGGESFTMAQRRALAVLIRWRRQYPVGTLLVVSHAGIIGSLLAQYMALPLRDVLRIPQRYACHVFIPEW